MIAAPVFNHVVAMAVFDRQPIAPVVRVIRPYAATVAHLFVVRTPETTLIVLPATEIAPIVVVRQRTHGRACDAPVPDVRRRTDRATPAANTVRMDKLSKTTPALPRSLLFAGLTAFALVAALPLWSTAQAQPATAAPTTLYGAARLHAEGLAMERKKDDKGAFAAFLAAATDGYPPSQRRLGEIYDHGNAAVPRNYEASNRWYQLAHDGGEDIPWVTSRMPGLRYGP